MNYQEKYLKYKKKYLNLRYQHGGNIGVRLVDIINTWINYGARMINVPQAPFEPNEDDIRQLIAQPFVEEKRFKCINDADQIYIVQREIDYSNMPHNYHPYWLVYLNKDADNCYSRYLIL
jgi:hypothetical protein